MPEILFIHIASASLALMGAYAALFAPKGGALHRRAGVFFVWAMIVMGFAASVLSLAKGELGAAGPMLMYLVITGVATMRAPDTVPRWLLPALMVVGITAGVMNIAGGFFLVAHPEAGNPAGASFGAGGLLFVAVLGDLRVLVRGPLRGSARLRRHLWRMCYAAFSATGAFFLGQTDEIPAALRIGMLLNLLAFLPAFVMIYYFAQHAWRRARARFIASRYVPAALEVAQ